MPPTAEHTVPASVNHANVKLYRKGVAMVAYREYPDRAHYTVEQDGREQVGDDAPAWARNPVASPS